MNNNLHISLTNIKNESRLLKETYSLVSHKIVDKVFIVGLWEEGLSTEEKLDTERIISRIILKSRNWSKNLWSQMIKYIEFSSKVIGKYKKENIKIITVHSLGLLPLGVLCKVVYSAKLVYDAHEYETQRQGLSGVRKQLSKILERKLIAYCDKVMVVSQSIACEYKKLYPYMSTPAVVLNVPSYQTIEKQDIFRKKWRITKDKTIFLYQGALSKGRGIEILLETFKNIKDNKAVIVFMGYGILENEIRRVQRKYKNIYFHEAVSPEILLDYTSSADFGISTIEDSCLSYHYCLPNKIFEYVMANIPVIVSNLPEMKKVVEENKIGVVVNKNTVHGLTDAIKEALYLDKGKMKKHLQKVKKIYNWEKQEKILLGVYNAL